MYARHFGLTQLPFSIAPDPRYLYMSERHREALAHLLYGVRGGGGGFVVLTGDIGAGKTTVCRCLLEQLPQRCNVAYIFNPKLTVEELLRTICAEFRIPTPHVGPGTATVKDHVDALNEYLLRTHAVQQNNVLIIDEAQNLSADVLEQLRLLTNLETNERKLLQIVLIGQPELRQLLARRELQQLAQRVIARYHLGTLSEAETRRYIEHRLSVAGLTKDSPFDARALVQAGERRAVEELDPPRAGHRKAVPHVGCGLLLAQRIEVVARDHPLGELGHLGPREQRAQLGLADQHDLQQLALAGLEVGQQAQLLEHLGVEVLGLVDHQHVVLPDRMRVEQEAVQRVDMVLQRRRAAAAGRDRHAELVADGLQQLERAELRVEDVGDVAALRDLLEEAAHDGGLAGADLAGQQHEAAAALQPVEQVRQRLAVALAHVEEARVRRDREGFALQAEGGGVHGRAG